MIGKWTVRKNIPTQRPHNTPVLPCFRVLLDYCKCLILIVIGGFGGCRSIQLSYGRIFVEEPAIEEPANLPVPTALAAGRLRLAPMRCGSETDRGNPCHNNTREGELGGSGKFA